MATAPSQVFQNYKQECKSVINMQINLKLYVSYVYLSMTYHFDRQDTALKNFSAYFLRHSHEEHRHAETLLQPQNRRRGRIQLYYIRSPNVDDWGSGLSAMEHVFHLAHSVNQSLLDLHEMATDNNDAQLCDFLERHFLLKQVRIITELGNHVSNLRNLVAQDANLAEYAFEIFTLCESVNS
ncbi:ferritin heavy chain-like [Orycteropus afer afer]|uniref:Ferritin heavy chain-like n=1 Tax=Orycteropus afer afer TaxID=1230840 RepID=A0AC54Z9A1_ORYAF|nr:ferritin heavy chain-like [Orycteropus afer afer]